MPGKRRGVALIKALLIAFSLALDVFAVAIGVGMRERPRMELFRIGAAFVTAEAGMTLLGAALGSVTLRLLGPVAGYVGFAALIGIGVFMVIEALGEGEHRFDLSHGPGLLFAALAISLDSLGIGFSVLFIGVPFPLMLLFIVCASAIAVTLGLLLGQRIGVVAGSRAGVYAGVLLALTGAAFTLLKVTGHG
jgi:putative Mn2+ efflux pump MntP